MLKSNLSVYNNAQKKAMEDYYLVIVVDGSSIIVDQDVFTWFTGMYSVVPSTAIQSLWSKRAYLKDKALEYVKENSLAY